MKSNMAAAKALYGIGAGTNSWLKDLVSSLAPQRGELPEVILENIKKHLPSWAESVHDITDQVEIKKLNGLSNSCYKVWLDKRVKLSDPDAPRAVLYRKIENAVVDKEIEYTIFKSMSDSGQGP